MTEAANWGDFCKVNDMEELSFDGVWTCAAKINGRSIQGSTFDGEWRWFVETTGPAWQAIHLDVWVFAGNTVEEARSLATRLGQLPDMPKTKR
jgi:hypothetical protein